MSRIPPKKTHREMLEEWQQEPEFKAAYDELETEFTLLRELLLARQRAGLTQAEVAEKMGTKPPAVDARPKDGNIHTKGGRFYDLRTNKHFTLKTRTLKSDDLQDFIACYNPENRHERKETERFKYITYDELIARDKANLDIFWLKDDSLDNLDELPPPEVLAQEIIDHLEAALNLI